MTNDGVNVNRYCLKNNFVWHLCASTHAQQLLSLPNEHQLFEIFYSWWLKNSETRRLLDKFFELILPNKKSDGIVRIKMTWPILPANCLKPLLTSLFNPTSPHPTLKVGRRRAMCYIIYPCATVVCFRKQFLSRFECVQ